MVLVSYGQWTACFLHKSVADLKDSQYKGCVVDKTKENSSHAFVTESLSKQVVSSATPRTAVRQQAEATRMKYHIYAQFIDSLFGWLRTAVRAGAWSFVAYCFYLAVKSVAGQNTNVQAVVDAVLHLGMNQWVAYAVAALCGVGYIHERRLRQKANRDQGNYIRELESKIDPGRSTSRLTETGRPTKEDSDAI